MVNDGHTTRPRCATRSLGERYIDGKPEEVPPDTRRSLEDDTSTGSPQRSRQIHRGPAEVPPHTRRSTRCTQPLVRSIWSAEAITTKFGKNLDLRGCTQSESQESKAPNPNPNDFILEPRSGSQKSADGYRYHPERLHPGAKVWIAQVRRRVPQPRPRQRSAEAITVGGIIIITNVEVDDRGSNQTRQLKIIPQLKSHNLAGVFRYWIEAIRTVIYSTLSPVHTSSDWL